MRRLPPVIEDILASAITHTETETYMVCSGPSQYAVRMTVPVPSCECVDWDRHYLPCKHMLAIAQHHGWDTIPLEYRQFPFFVLDDKVTGRQEPHVQEVNVSDEIGEVDTQSAMSDISTDVENVDTEVTAAAVGESTSGDVKATAKLQSQLRQKLSHLTSLSYNIDEDSLLTSIIAAVDEQVQLCTPAVRFSGFPQRNRRRIAKRNAADAFLKRRLKAAKRSKRARKVAAKQRKAKGNMSPNVS